MITVPSYGASDVRVFFNRFDGLDPSKPAFKADPDIAFQAFPVVAVGGAVVAAADMGSRVGGSFVNALDGKAEIVVGTGGGTRPRWRCLRLRERPRPGYGRSIPLPR